MTPPPVVQVRRLPHHDGLPLPTRQTAGSAGYDVHSAEADFTLRPLERRLVRTGLALAIPDGYEAQVRPRSGLALKHGLTLPNAPATIDSDYRGELMIPMINLGTEPVVVTRGTRIAQLVFQRVELVELEEVAELPPSDRGRRRVWEHGRMNRASSLVGWSIVAASLAGGPARASAQQSPLGVFQSDTDVGQVTKRGSVTYDARRGRYAIAGSGANMWLDRDAFHFVWRRIEGNVILTARAQFDRPGVEPHRKFGWSVRSSLESGSPHVTAAIHGDGLVALQFRRTAGGVTEEIRSPVSAPDVIELERVGNGYILSAARFGDTLVAVRVPDVELGDQPYVGLFVCAHNDTVIERATFRDVRITAPVREGFVPYREYIGSNLEILDVASGDRTVVYRSPESLQAPNWTKDGKALIYNSRGLLYRFDLAERRPVVVNTGFATSNNNDHVLSFDGRTIAISHHSADDHDASIVYTVPVGGGTPRRVTALGPSYLHGWSPDGRFLVYTGERNGEFDVYRIPADGGEETRLTNTPGLDDGPEYSPDGKYIYFNSVRSGTMQLWRMQADGSAPEQLTSDQYNNWFPHVSPDGRWIAFLSFMKDVPPGDHPFYKHVYLRVMSTGAGGGSARVVAYVYGGQGTINVPSWSPDSRRLAFVSNTDLRRVP